MSDNDQERDATDVQKIETLQARNELIELISRAFQEASPREFPILAGGRVWNAPDYYALEISDKGRYVAWQVELRRLPPVRE